MKNILEYSKNTIQNSLNMIAANAIIKYAALALRTEETKMNNIIIAKCECGNKVNVEIFDHLGGKEYLPEKYAPNTVRTHEALVGRATCSKCGSEVWIYSFIEVHRKEEK